ncbi:hypothetical protein MRX96_025364 [Rhipicephalus microplus]
MASRASTLRPSVVTGASLAACEGCRKLRLMRCGVHVLRGSRSSSPKVPVARQISSNERPCHSRTPPSASVHLRNMATAMTQQRGGLNAPP